MSYLTPEIYLTMKNSMSELFPGCEAIMEDVEINNNVTVPVEDVEQAEEAGIVEGETQATEGAEIEADATETEAAATAFARQFGELCHMQAHIETYGVDRTFLALCNRDNILGRAFGIQMPACESFDTVGSPYSPLSIACIEAMGDGMWDTFKKWVQKIWTKIKQFFIRIADWFRDIMGNNNMRFHRYKQWYDKNKNNVDYKRDGAEISKSKVSLPEADKNSISTDRLMDVSKTFEEKLASQKLWQDAMTQINEIYKSSFDELNDTFGKDRSLTSKGLVGAPNTSNDAYGGFGHEASKEEKKDIKKLMEAIDDVKDKLKDKKLYKFSNQEIAEWAKKSGLTDIGALMGRFDKELQRVERLIKQAEAFDRIQQNFDNAVKLNFDKLNSAIQRETGNSMGAKSRGKLSQNVNTINKIVFKSGVIPMVFQKVISVEFKLLSAFQSCTNATKLNDE